MINRDGARLALSGPVTLANVAELLEEGRRQLREGADTVDLAGVTELDSALLAMLLAWMRERPLKLANQPPALRTIARLYGVDSLLGQS